MFLPNLRGSSSSWAELAESLFGREGSASGCLGWHATGRVAGDSARDLVLPSSILVSFTLLLFFLLLTTYLFVCFDHLMCLCMGTHVR